MLNGFVVILSEKNDRSIGQTLVNISTVDENQQRLINIKEYLKTVNIRINKSAFNALISNQIISFVNKFEKLGLESLNHLVLINPLIDLLFICNVFVIFLNQKLLLFMNYLINY